MPDTKITALAAITTVDPAADVLPIVDISDTSMAASGTTKKITSNQILGAGGTATLASATITGDLTVATNKLKVTGGNVGIGTASPNNYTNYTTLTINGTSGGEIDLTDGGTLRGQLFSESTGLTLAAVGGFIKFGAGIGGTEKMRIDASGNCGIGVTPSAWGGSYKALQLQSVARNIAATGAGLGDFTVAFNAIYDSTDSRWEYAGTGDKAGRYSQTGSGNHRWFVSNTAGTAGNEITDFASPAMTLDASGNLLLATTTNTPSARQYINQASGSNPALYIAGGASTTPLINFNGAGRMRSDGQYLVMETTNASGVIYITANTNGVYLAVGGTSWTANSDERLKDIIEPISNAVAKVGSLRSVIGKFKNDQTNTRRSFLIAQDVQAVLPEAVDASNPDRLGVAYSEVIPLLVAAIKELTARVQTLETR